MNFDGSATPLNGSEFTLYDVTSQYYKYIANKSQQAAIVNSSRRSQVAPNYATKIKSVTTAGQGQALFNDLSVKNESGQYNVYLFLETKHLTILQLQNYQLLLCWQCRLHFR
ncbi:MAG: pilin N-terminal domain-containing protein [Streptococcus salivarius]